MNQSLHFFTRLWQIRSVISAHGLADLFNGEVSPSKKILRRLVLGSVKPQSQTRGVRIRSTLEKLGPVFIKLGQALSTRPDLLPADIALELSKLQDQVPPFDGDIAIDIIKQSLGDDFDDVIESIDKTPLASASVAQVHTATLKAGKALVGKNGESSRSVVIKVLRPDIKPIIESDLRVMYWVANFLEKNWSRGKQFKPAQVIKEYDITIHQELDLRQEAANCSHMAANFKHTDIIYVPQVYWDYTSQNVFVMERIYGTSIREINTLKDKGIDLKQLANDGVAVFFKQAFEDNFFHADMHPGNIFVSDEGKWIAVDFGIMGVLNDQDKQYLAEMLMGFFNRDYRSIAEAHLRAKWVPANTSVEDFESAVRMVCEPNFAKPIGEISFGKVMLQLFQTVRRFEIPVQPQLVLLYKTMLNIEGLGRQLYPNLDLWETAKPFLDDWMKKQLSPQALFDDFKRDWPKWRSVLPKLPDALLHLAKQDPIQQEALFAQQNDQHQSENKHKHGLQNLGLYSALGGFVVLMLEKYNVIQQADLAAISLWVVGLGLLLALYQRR